MQFYTNLYIDYIHCNHTISIVRNEFSVKKWIKKTYKIKIKILISISELETFERI